MLDVCLCRSLMDLVWLCLQDLYLLGVWMPWQDAREASQHPRSQLFLRECSSVTVGAAPYIAATSTQDDCEIAAGFVFSRINQKLGVREACIKHMCVAEIDCHKDNVMRETLKFDAKLFPNGGSSAVAG